MAKHVRGHHDQSQGTWYWYECKSRHCSHRSTPSHCALLAAAPVIHVAVTVVRMPRVGEIHIDCIRSRSVGARCELAVAVVECAIVVPSIRVACPDALPVEGYTTHPLIGTPEVVSQHFHPDAVCDTRCNRDGAGVGGGSSTAIGVHHLYDCCNTGTHHSSLGTGTMVLLYGSIVGVGSEGVLVWWYGGMAIRGFLIALDASYVT